ncbi:MAG: hypothetical protein GY868_19105 [Deltaproteobacteria bacterium]|nr:hypothetical protein [Deltaproteobacteria bacterium]
MQFVEIAVQAYSGYTANERPLSFMFRERPYQVAAVIDRWYEGRPDAAAGYLNYFKVHTTDDSTFVLRYNGLFDVWSLMVTD